MKRSSIEIVSILCAIALVAMLGCPAVEPMGEANGNESNGGQVNDNVNAANDNDSSGGVDVDTSGAVDVGSNGDGSQNDAGDVSGSTGVDANTNAVGAMIYASSGCGACHAADGSGGLGPSIRGVSVDLLDATLRAAESSHPGGLRPALTDQDLEDLATFLGSAAPTPTDGAQDPIAAIHTVDANGSGILHGSGLTDPVANCTACHGSELFGQDQAPACWSCHGSIWDAAPDYPPTHTKSKDGYFHGPGLESPVGDCDACHGANLTGTSLIPSCFSCHGAKWDEHDD